MVKSWQCLPWSCSKHIYGLETCCHSDLRVSSTCVLPHVCEWQEHVRFKIPFCLAKLLGSFLWKLAGHQHLFKKCTALDVQHCAFGSQRMAARLLFGRQSDRACSLVQTSYVFRCHGKHGFCTHSERHKHLLLQGSVSQQGDIHHGMAFIAGLRLDP